MNTLALSGFINSFLIFLIGIFVYLKNRKKRENQLFFLFCLTLVLWQGSYGFWQMAENEKESLFLVKFVTIGSVLSPVIFYHLILAFLNLIEKRKRFLFWLYLITFLLLTLVFSPLYISGVKAYPFYSYWPIGGIGNNLNFAWALIVAGIAFWLLIKNYLRLSGERKNQIGYFILAIFIMLIGGLFNAPQWYGISLYPYGNFIIFLYPLVISLAIIRYHLFEIRVILTEILVGAIGIISLIQALLAKTFLMRILGFGIFILFCIFGYLLIKSTHREIKAKEILEEKVKERTKELRKSKEELEESYEEIKKRKEDLEKFYKLTVGRELKMVELKKKIKELEEKLKSE